MRLLSVIVFLLLFQVPGYSQFAVGISGGGNASTVEIFRRPGFLTRNVKSIRGSQYGLTLRYMSEKHAGMQLEFNYAQRGWRDINDTSDVQYRRTMEYLEIPLKTHFTIGSGTVRILLEGGAYLGYMLDSRESTEDLNVDDSKVESDFVFNDNDNRWDYGLKGEAGFQFYFPFGAFEAKAYYSYGYGNLFTDKSQALEISQNRSYGITIGYLYFFGKKFDKKEDPIPTEDPK